MYFQLRFTRSVPVAKLREGGFLIRCGDMKAYVLRAFEYWMPRLPLLLMVWAFGFVAFLYGYLARDQHWFPFETLNNARIAAWMIGHKRDGNRLREFDGWSDYSSADGKKRRVLAVSPVADKADFLLTGGAGQYLEYCPLHGCLAVILKRDGTLVHAYPFRPDEMTSRRTVDLPYQEMFNDDAKDTAVFGLAPLPHGDLIVVFDNQGTIPQGGGIARVNKNGHIVWYRRDYSDHWPTLTDKGEIFAISHNIGPSHITVPIARRQSFALDCPQGVLRDLVRVLDVDGRVKEEIPIFDALLNSPYRTRLLTSLDPATAQQDACDPVHTNFVRPVGGPLAARIGDVAPADLLISLHKLSAIVIIGRSDHVLKHVYTGGFLFQHSAQPTGDGRIILFDDIGASEAHEPSRVLLFDPVSGAARTVFPTASTPKGTPFFSRIKGNINLSGDGQRALVAATEIGMSYEIRLSDGAILTVFDNLHDLHSLSHYASQTKMARFTQPGVYYVPPDLLN